MMSDDETCAALRAENAWLRQRVAELEQSNVRAEHLVQRVLDTIPDPVNIYDLFLRHNVYANHQVAQMFGYSEEAIEEMGNQVMTRLFHPDDMALITDWQERVAAAPDDAVVNVEFRYLPKNGEIRWFYTRSRVFKRLADGRVQQVVNISQDITKRKELERQLRESQSFVQRVLGTLSQIGRTERKQLEDELACLLAEVQQQGDAVRQSEERLRRVVQHMPVLLAAFNGTDNCVFWNATCEAVTGYSAAEVVGNTQIWQQLYPDPVYRARMMTELAQRGYNYRDWEWGLTTKAGEQRTIAWMCISEQVPIPGWDTWTVGVDVTERKRLEEQLRASEEQLRTLFERAPVGIGISRDGIALNVNPAYLRMFGYDDVSELIGKPIIEYIAPAERPVVQSRIQRRARGELVETRFALTGQRKDGALFPTLCDVIQVVLTDGQPASVGFLTDMTDLKRVEEERDQFFTLSRDLLCVAGTDGYFKRINRSWELTLGYTLQELLAEPYISFVHPDDRANTLAASHYARGNRLVSFENRYRCKDGTYKWLAWSYTLVPDQHLFFAVAHDITQRKRAEQEQQRLYQVAEGLRDVLAVLNSERPLTDILHFILEQATRLLEADAGVVYGLEVDEAVTGGTPCLRVAAAQGFGVEYVGLLLQNAHRTMCYQAIEQRRPIALTDLTGHLDVLLYQDQATVEQLGFLTEVMGHFRGMLAVPLIIKDEAYGTISLYNSEERTFTDEEIHLAMAFAAQSALAIENTRLRSQAEQAAVLEERARLARELHDSVTQALYSLTLLAEGCRYQALSACQTELAQDFARLGEIAQQALREMRLLIHQLRPSVLEREGLAGAVQQRLDSVERRAGIDARLLVEGEINLPTLSEDHLYRIIQEALNNALKHAGATQVTVYIRSRGHVMHTTTNGCAATGVEVEISDNGQGFDPERVVQGMGLGSMRERAQRLGGLVTITSAMGAGTTVRVRIGDRSNSDG